MSSIDIVRMSSPVGPLLVAAHGARVCALFFGGREDPVRKAVARWYPDARLTPNRDPGGAASALRAYFDGDLIALDRVQVELNGTEFQRRVWEALRSVPAGATASYSDIARTIGMPHAVRAVGAANGANPVAVIVPCHRIIGANGSLTGYGGGLHRKKWLLRHEAAQRALL